MLQKPNLALPCLLRPPPPDPHSPPRGEDLSHCTPFHVWNPFPSAKPPPPTPSTQHAFPDPKGPFPTAVRFPPPRPSLPPTASRPFQHPSRLQCQLPASGDPFSFIPMSLSSAHAPAALPEGPPLGTPPPCLRFLLSTLETLPRQLPPGFRSPQSSPISPTLQPSPLGTLSPTTRSLQAPGGPRCPEPALSSPLPGL